MLALFLLTVGVLLIVAGCSVAFGLPGLLISSGVAVGLLGWELMSPR